MGRFALGRWAMLVGFLAAGCGTADRNTGADAAPPGGGADTTVKRSQLLSNGDPCTAGSECTSGFCADGVCCNAVCIGECVACNVSGSAGTCLPNGTTCSDGNRCTSGDFCQAGTCLPGTVNACTPGDPKYVSVIDLGSAQGWSYAVGINNSGVVVGSDVPAAATSSQPKRGFRWSESGGMEYLPWPGAESHADLRVDRNLGSP